MQINERENERKPKVKRAKTNLEVLSTCWMEVFGLLNLKHRSKSPTCRTKITLRHHYYKLSRLNLDTQAFLISIPEIFASFLFIADRTSIIDVRHFDWVFSKFPYIGPVLDPSPSHLPLPPFGFVRFFFHFFLMAVFDCCVSYAEKVWKKAISICFTLQTTSRPLLT